MTCNLQYLNNFENADYVAPAQYLTHRLAFFLCQSIGAVWTSQGRIIIAPDNVIFFYG